MIFKLFKRKKDGLERLKAEIQEFRFNNPQELIKLIQPAILIDKSSEDCPLGVSKFSGQPDLPYDMEWPGYQNESMVFIGQVNLAQLADLNSGLDLPASGLLSFFIHFKKPESEYGAEYDFEPDRDQYKVFYFDDITRLAPKQYPSTLYEGYQFPEKRLLFTQHFQVPSTEESSFVVHSSLDSHDKELLFDFERRHFDGFMEQIGGYPVPVQQGIDLDWAAARVENPDERYEKALLLGKDYVNLFSFSLRFSFEEIGDSNCYFGITRENLEKMNFDEAVLILQDT